MFSVERTSYLFFLVTLLGVGPRASAVEIFLHCEGTSSRLGNVSVRATLRALNGVQLVSLSETIGQLPERDLGQLSFGHQDQNGETYERLVGTDRSDGTESYLLISQRTLNGTYTLAGETLPVDCTEESP